MIEALTGFLDDGHDDGRRTTLLTARLMATHPPLDERVRRLEAFELGIAGRGGGSR